MQVSASHDISAAVHLARILAADADSTTIGSPSLHQQDLSSSYMTPPAMTTHRPAHHQQRQHQQQPPNTHSQLAWQDDIAYLAPALAFNMGLQHELWPLMPQVAASASHSDRQAGAGAGAVQSKTHVPVYRQKQPQLRSAGCNLLIRPLRQFNNARVIDVPQSGRS